jgi:hypothetical protein
MADAGKPVTVQYFYKIRWGFQDEFVELFERNHWPLLRAQMESGRMLDVRAYEPRFHGDGRQDWTFEVTITYRDWAVMEEHTDPAILARLYPDAEKLKRDRGPLGHAPRGARPAALTRQVRRRAVRP